MNNVEPPTFHLPAGAQHILFWAAFGVTTVLPTGAVLQGQAGWAAGLLPGFLSVVWFGLDPRSHRGSFVDAARDVATILAERGGSTPGPSP